MSKAIQIKQTGGPEVLEWVDVTPRTPKAHEVRIENHAIGLNFIDVYFRTGLYPAELPDTPGMEGAGVVVEVGQDVEHLAVGDRVAYTGMPMGAYAEQVTRPAEFVVKLPDTIGFEQAAAGLLKGLTAQMLLRQTYRIKAGDTILLYAPVGGVGTLACQWAKHLGAQVIAVTSSHDKATLAKQNGAWATINYNEQNIPEQVLKLTDGQKCQVVYDSIGADTWLDSLDSLAPRGLMVSYGNASGPVTDAKMADLQSRGSLYATRPLLFHYMNTRERFQAMCQEYFELVGNGTINIFIGRKYELQQAGLAQQALVEKRTTGATILTP